jgi:uncharacterized protein
MEIPLHEARERLHSRLRLEPSMLVAYSGGVDSAYLAWETYQILGDKMLAVIADSPSLPRKHLAAALEFAREHGMPLRIVQTQEMQRPEYVRNHADRCFHCKDELFMVMAELSSSTGIATVAYGRNTDDSSDFRPGQRAAHLHRVVAPLAEAGLGKQQIRALAQSLGLKVWDKPASACLSSRLEYGRTVTVESLGQIEAAEDFMASLGFRQVRVRHHGELARIEIERYELASALSLEMLARITAGVRAAGFTFVTLDTEGYRSGSMNALLSVASLLSAKGVAHES